MMFFLFIGILFCSQSTALADKPVVACYFNSWTIYRHGLGQFKVQDIDVNLCSHIFYSFEGVETDGTFKILDQWGDINLHQIEEIISLKKRNPNLSILVSVGGFHKGSQSFDTLMRDPTARMNFISTSLTFIQKYGFDGLDIVWEFPVTTEHKENFARFIREARPTFNIHKLLLTAAVANTGSTDVYDVPVLSNNLDLITLLEYDFHGFHAGITGSNTPLYTVNGAGWTVNASVTKWISEGASPDKLLLGIAFYGKSYTLSDPSKHDVGSEVSGPGPIGKYTQEAGVLGYNEICELQMEGGWSVVWEDYGKVPYMYKGNTWISYDNVKSLLMKVEYMKSRNLRGVSVWALGIDDFHGTCSHKPNTLLTTINDVMGRT